MRHSVPGYVFALLATIIWSGNFVASRALATLIPPWQFNFWRWVIALIVLAPFALPHLRQDWLGMKKHWRYLSVVALLGITLMNTLVYKAGQTTQSLNMALLVPTSPVVILIFSRILYAEPITPRRLAGLVMVLSGVVLLVSRGDLERLSGLALNSGDFWALGGAFCFGLYSLFVRRRPPEISAIGFNAATFTLGLLFALPFTAAEACLLPTPEISARLLTGVLYAGLGCSFAAYWLWTAAIDNIGPVRAGIMYYSLPVFAAVGSVLLLDEQITAFQVGGGVFIVGGILAATMVPGRKKL
ncbi:MAG: DMT family transporter [Desulfovibrio sp.]|nr:DMT family transporter [Desulfovibrio sp.]